MSAAAKDDSHYDVAVLGGGIVGVSAALRCALAGAKVALIDAGLAGKASAAGAGIVSPVGLGGNEASREWSALVASAISHYTRILGLLGDAGVTDVGYDKVGEIVLATREPDLPRLDDLHERLKVFAAQGIPVGEVKRIGGAELQAAWPEFRGDIEGLYIENIARLDGRRMCAAIGKLAESRGARMLSGRGSIRLEDRSVSLTVDDQPLRADKVVLATGSWSQPLLELLGARTSVQPVRGQIVHLGLRDQATGRRPVINTFEGHYFLGFPDGRVVVGGTHEPEAGFEVRVTAGGVHSVLEKSLRVAPGLGSATHLETRVGLRPRSRDGYPIVGRPASSDNVIVATGLGAWGLTLGPMIGEIAAEQALGVTPTYEAGFLGPDREDITEPAVLSPNIQ
ncbi:MAG: NAD(P)/FAD-dependent oxidoreductase [Devosia sp.]